MQFFFRNIDELLPDQHHIQQYIILHTHQSDKLNPGTSVYIFSANTDNHVVERGFLSSVHRINCLAFFSVPFYCIFCYLFWPSDIGLALEVANLKLLCFITGNSYYSYEEYFVRHNRTRWSVICADNCSKQTRDLLSCVGSYSRPEHCMQTAPEARRGICSTLRFCFSCLGAHAP